MLLTIYSRKLGILIAVGNFLHHYKFLVRSENLLLKSNSLRLQLTARILSFIIMAVHCSDLCFLSIFVYMLLIPFVRGFIYWYFLTVFFFPIFLITC